MYPRESCPPDGVRNQGNAQNMGAGWGLSGGFYAWTHVKGVHKHMVWRFGDNVLLFVTEAQHWRASSYTVKAVNFKVEVPSS